MYRIHRQISTVRPPVPSPKLLVVEIAEKQGECISLLLEKQSTSLKYLATYTQETHRIHNTTPKAQHAHAPLRRSNFLEASIHNDHFPPRDAQITLLTSLSLHCFPILNSISYLCIPPITITQPSSARIISPSAHLLSAVTARAHSCKGEKHSGAKYVWYFHVSCSVAEVALDAIF